MIPALAKLPRVKLGNFPTPLTEAANLAAKLGGPRIFIKRDDLTGLAFGGNKCRKLEFQMGDAVKKGIDTIIVTGGSQSNFALQAATAARMLGMEARAVLILGLHNETQGNLLLHNILDTRVILVEPSEVPSSGSPEMVAKMNSVAEGLIRLGRQPLVIPVGGFNTLGTCGWVNAADELNQQMKAQKIKATHIVVVNGSAGTQAGLALGVKHLNMPQKVIGMSVYNRKKAALKETVAMANETAAFLKLDTRLNPEEVTIYDDYLGEGYGIITPECRQAIKLVAQTEGFFLDPVYTGKGMAGLIDLIKKGMLTAKDTVIFIHTGGAPALFSYDKEVAS